MRPGYRRPPCHSQAVRRAGEGAGRGRPVGVSRRWRLRPRRKARLGDERARIDQGADGQLAEASRVGDQPGVATLDHDAVDAGGMAQARRRPTAEPAGRGRTRPRSPACPRPAMARTSVTRSARRMNSPARNMPERIVDEVGHEVLDQGRAAAARAPERRSGRCSCGGPSPIRVVAPWCAPRRGRRPGRATDGVGQQQRGGALRMMVDEGGADAAAEGVAGDECRSFPPRRRRGTGPPKRRSRRRTGPTGRARACRRSRAGPARRPGIRRRPWPSPDGGRRWDEAPTRGGTGPVGRNRRPRRTPGDRRP